MFSLSTQFNHRVIGDAVPPFRMFRLPPEPCRRERGGGRPTTSFFQKRPKRYGTHGTVERSGGLFGLILKEYFNKGLLINSQGICCSRVAASCPSEPLQNGLKRLSDLLRKWLVRPVVQFVSSGRNTRDTSNNYAETSPVFFSWKQFCKGDIK